MRHRKRRTIRSEGVRLNMAAMLDMAFQLLAFFIATFKPMTLEQQIALKLPPPEAVKGPESKSSNANDKDVINLLQSLRIGLEASPDGDLAGITFIDDGSRARDVNDFYAKLKNRLEASGKASPIEQVILEVDPRLNLQKTMEVMDKCLQQTMPDGKPLTKISPVLAKGAAGK